MSCDSSCFGIEAHAHLLGHRTLCFIRHQEAHSITEKPTRWGGGVGGESLFPRVLHMPENRGKKSVETELSSIFEAIFLAVRSKSPGR